MAATNSVAVRTGNVSAGTSVFGMIVLEKDLSKPYDAIDMVTTPARTSGGDGTLQQLHFRSECMGQHFQRVCREHSAWKSIWASCSAHFTTRHLRVIADCGGLLAYNYFSGEHITGFNEGRPLFVKKTGQQIQPCKLHACATCLQHLAH